MEYLASAYRFSGFFNFFFGRMWKITLWFTRSGGRISSRLPNWIFRYQIWFLFSCFLLILISFLFICNSSLLRRVAFIYSLHIHDSPSVGITLVILTLIRSSSFSLLYSSTNRKRICVLNGALVIIWDLFGSLKQNGVLTLKNSAC